MNGLNQRKAVIATATDIPPMANQWLCPALSAACPVCPKAGLAASIVIVAESFIKSLSLNIAIGKGSGAECADGLDDTTIRPLGGSASGRSPFRPRTGLRPRQNKTGVISPQHGLCRIQKFAVA